METISTTSHQKNISTAIHLSTFTKWFFPFGNFIFPLILWTTQKGTSPFVDEHGRQAINFQLSTFLYAFIAVVVSLPFFIWQGIRLAGQDGYIMINDTIKTQGDPALISGILITALIIGIILLAIFLFEIVTVISASVAASRGQLYHFPLTIPFIKASEDTSTEQEEIFNQPINNV